MKNADSDMRRKAKAILLYAGFGLAVLALLLAVKFPWPALASRLAVAVNTAGVLHLSYLNAKPALFPPGLILEGVALASASDPDTPLLSAGRARLAPLWSALLLGRAGARLHAESYGGEIHGRLRADGLFSARQVELELDLQAVDLGRHPLLAELVSLEGLLSGHVSLTGAPGDPRALQGSGALSLDAGALRCTSGLLARENVRLGQAEAVWTWRSGQLELQRLALDRGDLQGEMKGSFQPGQQGRLWSSGRLAVDGSVIVEPTLVNMDRIPDQGLRDKLRHGQPLPLKWNGPVAPLVSLARMF